MEPRWNCGRLLKQYQKFVRSRGLLGGTSGLASKHKSLEIMRVSQNRVPLHQCLASFLHLFLMNIDFSWQLASISGPCLKIPSIKTTKNLSRCWFSSNQRHPADFGRSRSAYDLPDKSCMFSASEPTLCIRDCWFSMQRKMLVELGDNFDRHLIFGYVGGT